MNSLLDRPPGGRTLALPVSASAAYAVRLAHGPEEVRAAQRLRFEVFNLELGEGLEASYRTGFDSDPFDRVCDHLIVLHRATEAVVGTYRLQTGAAAAAGLGYYSEQEFDFGPFESLRGELMEVGRACVHRAHRNLAVLGLLWKGIASYAEERGGRYLVGCSSLPTLDPNAGHAAFERLARSHLAPPERRTRPKPGWECPAPSGPPAPFPLPKLMQAYFSLGAEVCGPPARDREFGTIDLLTLLDLRSLHPAARRRFFDEAGG